MMDLAVLLALAIQTGADSGPDLRPPAIRLDAPAAQAPAEPFALPRSLPGGPPTLPDPRSGSARGDETAPARCPMRIVPADPTIDAKMIRPIAPGRSERYAMRVVPPPCTP